MRKDATAAPRRREGPGLIPLMALSALLAVSVWAQAPEMPTPAPAAPDATIDWLNVARQLGVALDEVKGKSQTEVKQALQERMSQQAAGGYELAAAIPAKRLGALIPHMLRANYGGEYDVGALWFRPEFWDLMGPGQAPTFQALFATGALFGVARLEDLLPTVRRKAPAAYPAAAEVPASLEGMLEVSVGQTRTLLQGRTVGWLNDFVALESVEPQDPLRLFRATRLLWFPLTDVQGNEVGLRAAREVSLTLRDLGGVRVRRFRWESLPAGWDGRTPPVTVASREPAEERRTVVLGTDLSLGRPWVGEPPPFGEVGPQVMVVGAVGMPGSYSLGPGQTVEQIIRLAGDFRADADAANVVLLRNDGTVQRLSLGLTDELMAARPEALGAVMAFREAEFRPAPPGLAAGFLLTAPLTSGKPVMLKPVAPAAMAGAAAAATTAPTPAPPVGTALQAGDVIIVPPRK